MRFEQVAQVQAFQGVQGYLDENGVLLAAVNKSVARTDLDDVVTRVTGHHATQYSAKMMSRSRTENIGLEAIKLRTGHMHTIAEIARAKLVAAPDITEMRVPRADVSAPRLVAAARSMADTAEKYKQVFLDQHLPEDFLEQLRSAADAVEKAGRQRRESQADLTAATEGVDAQIVRGRLLVRVLNAMVVSQLSGQPELLRKWRFVKHVAKKPGFPRGSAARAEAEAAAASHKPQAEVPTTAVAPEKVETVAPTPSIASAENPKDVAVAKAA